MLKKLLPIVSIALLWACGQQQSTVERPRDVWVFRSVLDEQARMVTAGLNDNMWVAYNAESALLYKTWSGGVVFDGAVYTTAHGPQPTSLGNQYYQRDDSQWVLVKDGKETNPTVRYKGHKILNGQVSFSFDLITPDGGVIGISETPEYIKRGNQNGLQRMFESVNETGYEVLLRTNIGILQAEEDLKSDGKVVISSSDKQTMGGVNVTRVKADLGISPGSTEIKIFYHPAFDKVEVPSMVEGDEEPTGALKGATLIEGSDCEACHNETLKTVGPAYLTVAKKYGDDEKTVDMLAGKIIEGGSGVWGPAMMTPHPDLMEDDAKDIVRYILSLDDELVTTFDKYTLGEKSVPLKLDDKYEGEGGNGFMAHLYYNLERLDPLEVVENMDPIKQGPVSKIHTLSETDFMDFQYDIVVEYTGQLNIEKDGSYDFRLISDDGSYLFLDDRLIIDNGGYHGPEVRDGEMYLKKGAHDIRVVFGQGGGGAMITLQWFNKEKESFVLLTDESVSFENKDVQETKKYVPAGELTKAIPGDEYPLDAVHPAFDLFQARPDDFTPRVGGIDFLSDERMVVCTWDSLGPVFIVENWQSGDPAQMKTKRIASGLAEPLGLKVVDDEIYILQKQELTKLIDHDGDEIIDEYQTVSNKWRVSANFHEFAFGLVYQDGYFYGTLATAIMPGGASANPQIPDRGKVVKINKETGDTEFVAYGLRTPNGIGVGVDDQLFVADNQGDWLPASKIVHVQKDAFYGSRSVDFEGTEGVEETLPVVWLPQDEIGNSPSTPIELKVGPYAGQMIHGEVTNGGIKRVYTEKVNGQYQGALFRFTQGLEAGVNRILWAPDGSLMVGGVGSSGNWSHTGKLWYGLQRLVYNENPVFEMLKVSARNNGFVIEFTEPIKDGQNISAEDFIVQQWWYKPTKEYGGPKMDLEDLEIKEFSLSEDRKSIFFDLPGIKENHVVYFRIKNPFESESGNELWSTECWYTLNQIPDDKGSTNEYSSDHNELTKAEESNGWKLLFDGKTTNGVRNYGKATLGDKWVVDNGTIHFTGKDGRGSTGGDIVVTDKPYKNYEFYVEWKISERGNSGIIYNVIESDEYQYPWLTGPEMQVLDNAGHPDGQYPKHLAGDLYDMISAKFITAAGPGEWNRARLVMKDGHVEHWLNGYKIVEFDMWTEEWDQMVAGSKFKDMPAFGTGKEGHIVLQDHSDKVWYRNIKIREL